MINFIVDILYPIIIDDNLEVASILSFIYFIPIFNS